MSAGKHKPELYRWRRQAAGAKAKPDFDSDNVEHWIKRVEQASEFAVSEVFSRKKLAPRPHRPPQPALTLQSVDQLHDHDDAYSEAQDLLSEWLSNKLNLELVSDEDNEPEGGVIEPAKPPPPEFTKYSRFDDLYNYLEKETESENTQDFLQNLLEKEVVDSGILESLRSETSPRKRRDPRVTMEVRHQQVKENRAQRQQEAARRRQELALKKSALAEAQMLVQEENRQKTLKTKKEEEEIQREMVKLRKEMSERKRLMEEARRAEWKRQEVEKKKKEVTPIQRTSREDEEEARRREKRDKIEEMLHQIYAENHRRLHKHFSIWYKLVLERRVKTGKARALADWRLQLRTFRAWRDHVWSGKMEQETQQMEKELRDQNRKQQAAAECYHKRLLRRCLVEWQLWCRSEKEKQQLEARKEETKRKMAALLDAASSVGGSKWSSEGQGEATIGSHETAGPKVEQNKCAKTDPPVTPHQKTAETPPAGPRHAWQVTPQHASLTPEELERHRLQPRSAPQGSAHPRRIPPYGENFENRHVFQQKLIEEQRRQLQEQKEMILGLMENQKLMITRQEAKNASAVTAELTTPARVTHRSGSDPNTKGSSIQETPHRLPLSSTRSDRPNKSPAHSEVSTSRGTGGTSTPHPAVIAMEERAAQRAERRRLMEEMRRKREEDKLAQLRAAEEQRLHMELAEKEAQLEKKREEKRLQRQKEEEKQRRLQREQEMLERAKLHNERRLLRVRGLEPWKKLLEQCRHNMEGAASHHCRGLLSRGFLCWSQAVRMMVSEKIRRAEQLYTTLLLRRTFQHWLRYKDYLSIQEERAARRHKANLQRRTFMAWLDVTQEEKMAAWDKQRTAAEHNQRRILLSALRTWRRFPKVMKDLRLQQERRDILRKKVAEILPDFGISPDNREM
ncbi:coiled-coil domain-containing protein 191 isoform X2 [Hyla sarda]|uniref:coiled-coil domain-containing protein 191 isoform X2 n=1 Tax=Hyla sarda TaxID=327740 RepID=UPI0024C2C8A9|nr:coiled-coil domain-containing protein 191 isoform X2 [Hyla sarda]